MEFDDLGREVPDQTPVEMPLNFRRPEPLVEMIRRYVRTEMSEQAAAAGMETWEEADDFAVGDDEEPFSPHELLEMQEEKPVDSKLISGDNASSQGTDRGGNPKTGLEPPKRSEPVPAPAVGKPQEPQPNQSAPAPARSE